MVLSLARLYVLTNRKMNKSVTVRKNKARSSMSNDSSASEVFVDDMQVGCGHTEVPQPVYVYVDHAMSGGLKAVGFRGHRGRLQQSV
jgi:hypothetical protein